MDLSELRRKTVGPQEGFFVVFIRRTMKTKLENMGRRTVVRRRMKKLKMERRRTMMMKVKEVAVKEVAVKEVAVKEVAWMRVIYKHWTDYKWKVVFFFHPSHPTKRHLKNNQWRKILKLNVDQLRWKVITEIWSQPKYRQLGPLVTKGFPRALFFFFFFFLCWLVYMCHLN